MDVIAQRPHAPADLTLSWLKTTDGARWSRRCKGRQLIAQSASRHHMARLTWAMRRVPDASQVPILDDMLGTDRAGVRAAKVAFAANQSNRHALDEMRISHVHEYRVVLTTIGTEDAEAVLKRCLLDREFGAEAAVGLQVIWQQRHEPMPEGKFGNWPDFARAAANRSRDRARRAILPKFS